MHESRDLASRLVTANATSQDLTICTVTSARPLQSTARRRQTVADCVSAAGEEREASLLNIISDTIVCIHKNASEVCKERDE